MVSYFFLLSVIYQLKHFVCDFVLQNTYMAFGKEKGGREWLVPLTAHAGIHALGTLVIFCLFAPHLSYYALVDFAFHFVIDRVKGSPYLFVEVKKNLGPHITLAIDQMLHHLTHYILIYSLIHEKFHM